MGRRLKKQPQDPLAPEGLLPPAAPVPPPPRMANVRVEREYQEPVDLKPVTNGTQALPEESPASRAASEIAAERAADAQFAALLQDMRLVVVVERDEPTEWNGIPLEPLVYEKKCPKEWLQVVKLVTEKSGGGKYRMMIINPRNGTIMGARQFDVQGDPVVPDATTPEDRARAEEMYRDATSKEENDPLIRLEKQRLELEKTIDVEKRQQDLEELKQRRAGLRALPNDGKIEALERRLETTKIEAKLEMIERENRLLREQQQKALVPVPREGKSDMAMLFEQMREDRRDTSDKFTKLLQQMQSDKMDAMAAKLDAALSQRSAAPGANALRDQLAVIGDIGKMFGIKLKHGEEDDEEPKELWERLVDKYAPRLFDLFESKKKEGKTLTREEMIAEMKKIEDETVDNVKKRLLAEKKSAPAPAGTSASAPTTAPANPAVTTPPAATPPAMSIEDEKKARAATVLAGLERESELRPRSWEWTEACWRMMPEEYLEKMCMAADPIAMISVFDGVLLAEKLAELKNKFSSNEKAMVWVKQGHDELKEWYQEALKDSKFDPFVDDEEE